MAYGVTATGFAKKTLAVIKSEWEASAKQAYGNSINLRPPSLIATFIGIASDREAKVWDMAEETWNSRGASTAQGVSADNVGELTAEDRIGAAASKVTTQYFFGTAGTVIPTTFTASVSGNSSAKFAPQAGVTLIAGVNEVQKLSFSAVPDAGTWTATLPDGQATAALAYNAIASAVQAAINALTGWEGVTVSGDYTAGFTVTYTGNQGLQPWSLLAATSLVTHTAVAVTITPSELTAGVPQGSAVMLCNSTGPIAAPAGTLTTIETPISGLTRTTNRVDAVPGRLVETDAEYRIRRANELQKSASATVEAIRLRVKEVAGVLEAIVYENTSLTTDGNGVPGKAVHIYVEGGADADVALGIWNAVGGGIQTYGGTTVVFTDSQGLSQSVSFDRAVQKPVYVTVALTTDAAVFPATGDAQVTAAILAYAATLKISDDVLLYPKLLPAIVDNVPGILDLTVKIGFAPSPSASANLTIGVNEIATFSAGNIVVTP